jgi:hypothetical protein
VPVLSVPAGTEAVGSGGDKPLEPSPYRDYERS